MPAISRASAPEERYEPIEREPVHEPAAMQPPPAVHLWRDALGAATQRAMGPVLAALRSGWVYRQTLYGPVPDRIAVQPNDPRPRRLDEADAMFKGRFRLGGKTIDARNGSIFDARLSHAGMVQLHGFDWLRHLEGAGGEVARALALQLAEQWLARNIHFVAATWAPEITATRFLNLFAHGRFFLARSDLLWRSKFFVSLRNQARVLSRSLTEAPEGIARFEAAAAMALAGLCLSDPRNAADGLAALSLEIQRQILPDGGHISRSPEALLAAFRALAMVDEALGKDQREAKSMTRSALDRMAPMVRFFRMGDGGLAVFQGGNESDPRLVAALLAHDDAHGRPFGHAPHSGYQRLTAGKAFVVMDVGRAPPGDFSRKAHASCLAFEMSIGAERLIVNCGASIGDDHWGPALRATPAHSTLTLADASSAHLLPAKSMWGLLGARLLPGPFRIETRRGETEQGLLVEATHDGYARDFGIVHERRMALSLRGNKLTGVDRVIPGAAPARSRRGRNEFAFAIRFHVHPDVRLSLAQGGGSVILKLASGEGWRFRASGAESLTIEDSIYLGGGAMRRAEQLVITGHVKDMPAECAWLLEQVSG